MIYISFSAGMVAVCIGWILIRYLAYCHTKTLDWRYEAKQIFFLINLLVLTRITFYPFEKLNGQIQPLVFEAAAAWPFRVNLTPFVNLLDYETRSTMLLNVIGNSAMFIPTGIMTPMIYKSRNSLKKVVATGFLISLTIEILQLPFAVRASDVDDLILNTAGCFAGYCIYALIRRFRKK
jgi:glycopeptide antibiotics resistance protein